MSPVSFDLINSSIFPTSEGSIDSASLDLSASTLVPSTSNLSLGTGLALTAALDQIKLVPAKSASTVTSPLGAADDGFNLQSAAEVGAMPPTLDALTGTDETAPLLLQLAETAADTNVFNGRLEASDRLNPTRLGRYKDDFVLNPPEAGRLQLDLESWEFDAYLQLIDGSTGQVILENDDYGSGTDSQLVLDVAAGAELIVRVTSFDRLTVGEYSLTAALNAGGNSAPGSGGFSTTSGYGLVDAAAAVSQALGGASFEALPDLGSQLWNNNMVNAPEVWAQGFTGKGVTVAVIDSGVDIYHEDLLGNIWVNDGEVAGDGIDNDNNGYVDDLHGWNFGVSQNNGDVTPGSKSFGQDHGTHVAGTIAAKNNGIGMTGVAPDAKIMAIRMGNVVDGFFTNAGSLAQAITYAVDNGAKVVNMSLGWTDSGDLRDALAYAASKNVITVSAAGNDGRLSPASVPGKYATNYGLTVGAVDIDQEIASFSNLAGANSKMQYVVAPGVEIYSTLPGNRYGFQQGTSMASPHVAGVVALMLSANPNLTHDQVRAILTETGLDLAGQISSQGPIAGSGSGSRLTSPLDTGSAAAALGPKPESEVDYALTDAVLADLEASTAFGAGVSTWGKSRINPPDSISSEESADSGVFLVAELATSVFEKLTVADLGISSEADLANTSSFSLEQDWVAQEFTEFVLS